MNQFTTELCHHGIMGMHWGVRRYQPYSEGYQPEHAGKFLGQERRNVSVGQLTRKEKKALKKEVKARKAEYDEDYYNALDEAESRPEIKKLGDKLQKEIDNYYNSEFDEDEEFAREQEFLNADLEYHSALGKAVASSMIDKYGFAFVQAIDTHGSASAKTVDDFITKYGNRYWEIHGAYD